MPISERVGGWAALVLLAACSEQSTAEREAEARVERPTVITETNHVFCAHPGDEMASNCTIERYRTDQGLVLTVRHLDGAFRRLAVTTDGRGIVAADGAEPARVTILDANRIEVAIGGDRYQLPATVQEQVARP
jgi:hypothetical protein